MTAVPAPRPGWELLAGQVNQRPYEALRAYLYQGLPLRDAADATGYTREALDYSYRLSHDHQLRFLAALDKQMIATGLATASEAIFDLDFHAVMHWGDDPALEKHYVPARSQRTRSV